MPFCSAINCTNRLKKGCGKTFHRFPRRDNTLLKKWLVNMGREEWTPSKYSTLCSDHFVEKCFDRTGQTTRIRSNAVPTVFNLPPHLLKPTQQSEPQEEDDTNVFSADQLSAVNGQDRWTPITAKPLENMHLLHEVKQTQKRCRGLLNDHSYSIQESPRSLKRKLEKAYDQLSTMKRRLRTTQTKAWRLKKKMDSLNVVVKTLKEMNYLTEEGMELLGETCDVPAETKKRFVKSKRKASKGECFQPGAVFSR